MTLVGILGFSGYSGADLVRILSGHPQVEPVLLEHRNTGDRPRPIGLAGPRRLAFSIEAVVEAGIEVVFLATPPEASMELAPPLLNEGIKVIDLSGAFRLRTPENYQRWYKATHTQPGLLAEAAYGLPELCRSRIPVARLISNPGCYPTAANLTLRPLLEAGAIKREAGIVSTPKAVSARRASSPR